MRILACRIMEFVETLNDVFGMLAVESRYRIGSAVAARTMTLLTNSNDIGRRVLFLCRNAFPRESNWR